MKRVAVRGIILKDNNIMLIHRIRNQDGKRIEYHVFPGGGLLNGESIDDCLYRELKEELGIQVNIIRPLYYLEDEKNIEHYILCEYVSGEFGTGKGAEFTEERQATRGSYIPEILPLSSLRSLILCEEVKDKLLKDIEEYSSPINIPLGRTTADISNKGTDTISEI